MKLRSLLATALPAMLFASTAHAVRQPDYLAERPLETAGGSPGRNLVRTASKAPTTATARWRAFAGKHGAWTAVWDADTAVPRTVFGPGIAAPGAVADGALALDAATKLLAEQLELLAPGAQLADFVVSHNVLQTAGARPMRVVSMAQHYKGLRVVGGGVTFVFKNDRLIVFGSTAAPAAALGLDVPTTLVDARIAEAATVRWIGDAYGADPTITAIGAPLVLPIIRDRGPIEHRVVVPVTADLAAPRALWTVYVDAVTGAPVARTQRLLFAEGTVRYNAGVRQPASARMDYPAAFANLSVAAQSATSTVTGGVTWAGTAATTVTTSLVGTYARILNGAGGVASASLPLSPSGTAVWNEAASEFVDAQLTSYVHATIAKRYAIDTIDPGLGWLAQRMDVTVNENDICNAYSNLDDIHFFRAGSTQGFTCENTGRLADVVYHEFGHSLHGQSVVHNGEFDGALSEGISDYYAATITGDPAMGLGFFSTTEPLRHIDPPGSEAVWPDDQSFDTHETGLIIAGALWDLRKGLIAKLGEAPGIALADDIFYAVISRSVDIPGSYAQALAEDDDDGNLSNGTPNQCQIDTAFAAHGLASVDGGPGTLLPPTQVGFAVALAQPAGGSVDCPSATITGGTVRWHLRDDAAVGGEVALTVDASGATATLPTQDDGVVIQYQVDATLSDGAAKIFPQNAADPWYELFVGPVTEIACFDFEEDPAAAGWTFTGAFQWGAASAGADDPAEAYSPTRLIGNAIGGNYSPGANALATSPVIDTAGFDNVRLQYRRWLNIEDAAYDQATIASEGTSLWTNLDTPQQNTHHRDREWRFQDLDLSAQAADGTVQVTFALVADQGLEFGGWSVDDVCVVALGPAVCGDGFVTAPEQCDDGNSEGGDGCSALCETEVAATCGDGVNDDVDCPVGEDGGCCSTGTGAPTGPLALGLVTLGLVLGRRRRRA